MAEILETIDEVDELVVELSTQTDAVKIKKLLKRIKSNLATIRKHTAANEKEVEQLQAKQQERSEIAEILEKLQRPTYADAIKGATKSVKNVACEERSLVTVDLNNPDKSTKQQEKEIKEIIKPSEFQWQIKGVRTTKNKLLIETGDKAESTKIAKKLTDAKFAAKAVDKKSPQMLILGVNRDTTEAELTKCIAAQNFDGKGTIKVVSRSGRRDTALCNWIIETDIATRDRILAAGRLYIEWQSCRTVDHIPVTRCFKCNKFGHPSKYCSEDAPTCGHCSSKGHEFKDCPNKASPPKCANCSRFGKPANHDTRDSECPAYKNALRHRINNTKYV